MSTFRNKAYALCESLLRVPPLLIVDEVLRLSFGVGGRLVRKGVFLSSPVSVIADKSLLFNDYQLNESVVDPASSSLTSAEINVDYDEDDDGYSEKIVTNPIVHDHGLSTVLNDQEELSYGAAHENVSTGGSSFLPFHFLSLFFPGGTENTGATHLRDHDGYLLHLNMSSSISPSETFLNEDLITLSEVFFSMCGEQSM